MLSPRLSGTVLVRARVPGIKSLLNIASLLNE
jgi:hypothetical protein